MNGERQRVPQVETALVTIWGELVGAVAWDPQRELATFEFDRAFLLREPPLDLAPLKMSRAAVGRGDARFSFRHLAHDTFYGLPGLLADALPDAFGNSIIDAWLGRQGRTADSFSPVERLCYTGTRGMGALEFKPAMQEKLASSVPVAVADLVQLAQDIATRRSGITAEVTDQPKEALLDIIRVGTSAGGGRPKAVIALNEETGEVRSGQVVAPAGYTHWLLKFDGVHDHQLGAPAGYGRIEYAYYLMAQAAGITMARCRLLTENGRAHFMTRRFDRPASGGKLHLQSLCAMAHFDFNEPASWSYEQAFQVMRELRLSASEAAEQYRRMVFNVVARNQDDHTKNIAYMMDETGQWRLSPAFDVTFACNPAGAWTARHQMSVNGKREDITRTDLLAVAAEMNIRQPRDIISEVGAAVQRWPEFADEAGVTASSATEIGHLHRRCDA